MNEFVVFCRAHGLIVDSLQAGRWVRVPTIDHPKKRNGAYRYLGDVGWVQNHATMVETSMWRVDAESPTRVDPAEAERAAKAEMARLKEARQQAAEKAKAIVSEARLEAHPYLAAKGFPEAYGLVWERPDARLLIVPMYAEKRLVGCQMIAEDGGKKFLKGQQTKGATFTIGRGAPIFCEGYATALSVQAAASAARMQRSVVVCFSAHNLTAMADQGAVVADNDESMAGELAAKATKRPYWISDRRGEDFNDFHLRAGLFAASQALKLSLMPRRHVLPEAAVP